MDLRTQARLLRAIEQREVDPVSHVVSVPLDVRFVATTTKDLHKEVRCGRFRSDLLFRLNVITLKVPPLRERPAGLLALAELFVQKFAVINGRPARTISDDARYTLQRHTWPGNVRELENVLQRAVLTETGPSITPLALDIDASGDDDDRQTEESAHSCGNPAVLPTTGRTIEAVEKDMILDTLCQSRGNRSHTAAVLGISIRTLRNKLHAYERDGTRIPRPVVIGVA
jgi:DNA-binding NtrC family response regulator